MLSQPTTSHGTLDQVRRLFADLHSALRNAGLNPIEAVTFIATLLEGHDRWQSLTQDLPADVSQAASTVIRTLDPEVSGVAFQQLMVDQARSGLGQYLTPGPVAHAVAEIMATRIAGGVVLDPFCGAGLLLEHLGRRLPSCRLRGIEINPAMATVARASAHLSSCSLDVQRADSFEEWCGGRIEPVDAVVTNPPFGALATTVSRRQLEAAGASPSLLSMKTIPAELLGLDLALSVLRPEGVIAVVLPQSFITNLGWSTFRSEIFRRLSDVDLIGLPEETFAPFRGVAKAVVLIGSRRDEPLPRTLRWTDVRGVGYDHRGKPQPGGDLEEATQRVIARNSPASVRVDGLGTHLRQVNSKGGSPRRELLLGDVAEVLRGRNPAASQYATEGPWILKVGDLAGSFISWKDRPKCHVTPEFFSKTPPLHLRVGDICLTGAGHRPKYIGLKVDLMDTVPDEGALPSAEVVLIRLGDSTDVSPVSLLFFLRSQSGYEAIQALVRGSSGHLYPEDLRQLVVPSVLVERQEELESAFLFAARQYRAFRLQEETMLKMVRTTLGRSVMDFGGQ